jgi:hypothetical protein
MSTRIADDNVEFKALQKQLKTGGATTSAGIKHILHDNIVIRFNEMKEKGLLDADENEFGERPAHEDQKWAEMLKKRLALKPFRRGSSERSLFEKAMESRTKPNISPFANDTNIYSILLPEHTPDGRPPRKLRRRTVGTMAS